MPRYRVTIDGKSLVLDGDHPPSEDEARAALQNAQAPMRSDVGVVGKAQSDDPRELVQEPTTWWGGFTHSLLQQAGIGDPESPVSHAARPRSGADVAGLLLPSAVGAGSRVVNAVVPNAERAGQKFAAVKAAAANVPVSMSAPGDVALRIQQLADRGGTMPRAVSKLIQRTTNPNLPAMAYPESRDFASNISRLSADEYGRLTPVIQREMGNLRTALNAANGDAAAQVGMGDTYNAAMREYAHAAKLQSYQDALVKALQQKALPFGLGAGTIGLAGYLGAKAKGLLGE